MEEVVDQPTGVQAIVGEADLTETDLAEVVTQLPGSKRPWLVPAVMAAFALLSLGLTLPTLDARSALTMLLPIAFVVILSTFFQRVARRAWVKQALANIGGQTTFRFDDYGFTSESSLRQHRLAWSSLSRALETPAAFLVYTTPRTVLVVPKRAFTEPDVARLSHLLPERVTPTPSSKAGLFNASANRTLLMWVVLVVAFLSIWHFLDEGAAPRHRDRGQPEDSATPATRRGGEASDVDSSP